MELEPGTPAAVAPLFSPPARGVGDLSGLATTIEAEDSFDLAACRTSITARTLIVAGDRARFYGSALVAETAHLIPNSTVRLFRRRGNVTVTSDRRFAATVGERLPDGRPAAGVVTVRRFRPVE